MVDHLMGGSKKKQISAFEINTTAQQQTSVLDTSKTSKSGATANRAAYLAQKQIKLLGGGAQGHARVKRSPAGVKQHHIQNHDK